MQTKVKKALFLCLAATFIISASKAANSDSKINLSNVKHAKYIFLMIGDGMGTRQRESAEIYKTSKLGLSLGDEKGKLVMNKFPVTGHARTLNALSQTTDSAAAGTALACGEKTENKIISMAPDCNRKLKSLAFFAKERGMRVGIISSVPIDHATPATFYATVPKRSMYYEIAMSLPSSNFDFFAGNGFLGANKTKGRKSPEDNAREQGYKIVKNKKALKELSPAANAKTLSLCEIKYEMDMRRESDTTLLDLTEAAIKMLDNPKGFFLMVEGGKIDYACHRNDSAAFIKETLAFDNAVKAAYDFYKKHPNDTLIVVTADHETGGIKQSFDKSLPIDKFYKTIDTQKMSSTKFYSKIVKEWKKNNASFSKALEEIKTKLGLSDLTEKEKSQLQKAYDYYMEEKSKSDSPSELTRMYGSRNPVQIALGHIISKRCGIAWSTFGHSVAPVKTTAIGKDAGLFKGSYENTDICKILRAAILSKKE